MNTSSSRAEGRPPFERTTCACSECVQCCKDQPGPLAPGDMQRIASYLGRKLSDVFASFWASPGAVVKDTRTGNIFRIGTITPKRVNGRCIFLTANDRCGIHAVAPFGCAYFDTHQQPDEYQARGRWLYMTVVRDADYQAIRSSLDEATSWKPRGV